YSIKKLEPLYMGEHLRSDGEGAVAEGADSVVAYHEFREMRGREPEEAAARLASLEDYNAYDCLSTLRLRDWLLERAAEAGVADRVVARSLDERGGELSVEDPVFARLMSRSGPAERSERTAEQQAYAMLATAIDYNRRESKSFWWDHFDRLQHPVEEWRETRDVFVVESAEVVADWVKPTDRPRARNLQRTVRLVGDWAPGSKDGQSQVAYTGPLPPGVSGPESALYGAGFCSGIVTDPSNPRVVELRESRKPEEIFSNLPVALVPAPPPRTEQIDEAIYGIAAAAAEAEQLPESAALDVLARRAPRLRAGATGGDPLAAEGYVPAGASSSGLPTDGTTLENVIAALPGMDDSYVAVQGPPGSGKTYIGSRVIRALVERHGWRIGVVAQSHAVVENMLGAVVRAGLDPARVAKSDNQSDDVTWTTLRDGNVEARAAFLAAGRGDGCVLGGTAWTFANPKLVEPGGMDLLVVDEAGQFSLAPTLAVSVAAARLLLLGDPQQLPQVSQGSHAEPVDESALGWLVDGRQTLPAELGYFLEESYRMRPELSAKVSVLSYEGRLGSAQVAGQRVMAGAEPGLEVVVLEHTGNRAESEEEAREVVAQVRAHLGLEWTDPSQSGGVPRPLEQRDFVVVAPYNAQVSLIQRSLMRAGFDGVRVGTVDRFQGQEAPIAIVSMTASSHGDVPRGMGFVLNRNRTNVAVSRAQYKAILIRSRALTAYMPATAAGVVELGAFIGLCS
nr:AAA family ATPase [Actinomycetales bacterium]